MKGILHWMSITMSQRHTRTIQNSCDCTYTFLLWPARPLCLTLTQTKEALTRTDTFSLCYSSRATRVNLIWITRSAFHREHFPRYLASLLREKFLIRTSLSLQNIYIWHRFTFLFNDDEGVSFPTGKTLLTWQGCCRLIYRAALTQQEPRELIIGPTFQCYPLEPQEMVILASLRSWSVSHASMFFTVTSLLRLLSHILRRSMNSWQELEGRLGNRTRQNKDGMICKNFAKSCKIWVILAH